MLLLTIPSCSLQLSRLNAVRAILDHVSSLSPCTNAFHSDCSVSLVLSYTHSSNATLPGSHHTMRTTLRRSCDACAKSKLRCDLLLPQCSRCFKRKIECLYANEPLSASLTENGAAASAQSSPGSDTAIARISSSPGVNSFDPFDSYPQTRLPRALVQRLVQHCTCY
ncbi:MAG: Zn(II)2Cys6 transcription factor [Cytophagaceae bacterium]|nr:MAG: Zn(II)2Cys6 transcription factor [Cytophagaceae bacterium]